MLMLFVGGAIGGRVPPTLSLQRLLHSGRARSKDFVDRFGRRHNYLRISLTERCNLRCTYCMPEEGVQLQPKSQVLADDEVVRLASAFVANGVDKIRLTGGEPLVRKGIVDICGRMKGLGVKDLAMTTNGILLRRKLDALVENGLNLVNISLDTLVASKFQLITRRQGFTTVLDAIRQAEAHPGLSRVKVNCVVKRGLNDDEILDFVEMTKELNVEIRFIEFMPFDGNKWKSNALIPYFEMADKIKSRWPDFARAVQFDERNAVSKTWRVPGFKGTVGFITSMTHHFCGSCNRLRLTADGIIKACLFGKDEVSLRDVLRSGASDDDLASVIQQVVSRKHAKLGGHDSPESISLGENRSMILIGG